MNCHKMPEFTLNTLRPRQNGPHFADDTFKRIFVNETFRISIKISLKFVPKGPINNIPALVQIMAWRRSGDKPLSEPMMVWLLTHICITRLNELGGCTLYLSTVSRRMMVLQALQFTPSEPPHDVCTYTLVQVQWTAARWLYVHFSPGTVSHHKMVVHTP